MPTATDTIYRCAAGHTTSATHHHSRSTVRGIRTVPWDDPINLNTGILNTRAPGGMERHCAPDGTQYMFSTTAYTTELTQPPSNEESSMPTATTTTFAPGDIVTSRLSCISPTHLHVVVGVTPGRDHDDPSGTLYTTLVSLRPGSGWPSAGRDLPHREVFRPHPEARFWNLRERDMVKVPDAEARDLPRDVEEVRRAIQIAAFGQEPVLLCDRWVFTDHPAAPHRHSTQGGRTFYYRDGRTSRYTPIPGLWTTDPTRVTAPSQVVNVEDPPLRVGEEVIVNTDHPNSSLFREGERVRITEVPHPNSFRAASIDRPDQTWWLGRDDVHQPTPPPQTDVPIDLPLRERHLREHASFTLTSRPIGRLDGSELVFGCQRFPLQAVLEAGGSISHTPTGMRVTSPASRARSSSNDEYLWVADRDLHLANINEYVESVVAHPGAAAPTPTENAVVMRHGFYRCEAEGRDHEHVLFLLPGNDGLPVMGNVRSTGNGGIVGIRSGLFDPSLRGCRPVSGSCTSDVMRLESGRHYSLVPCTPEQVEFFRGRGVPLRHVEPNADRSLLITECDADGVVTS